MTESYHAPTTHTETRPPNRESSRWPRRESVHDDLERGQGPAADFRRRTSKADCRRRRIANSECFGPEKKLTAVVLSAANACSVAGPCRKEYHGPNAIAG